MVSKDESQSLTHELLRRAHSPDSANRIYSEKIQHRPLFLKPSSPPPSTARDSRRKAREEKKRRAKALKPKPLSARERRKLGLYDLPKTGLKYSIFTLLNNLWLGYIREILGTELYNGGQGAAAKLSAADFHGAEVEVSRSRCPSRVGIRGIVVKDSRFTFEVVTQKNQVRVLPKEGTMFRIHVPAPDAAPDQKPFCFEIHGDQFQHRSSDRANKKFKNHFLTNL
ncbi:RNase P/MRP, p29 subunit [Xylariaceae sp. FL1651]|nr:RNase P/MRP, p29 subunit [Xylariaceae sp. FL1651]